MIITATEFKSNVGKFLQLSQGEDILIMKNGKLISKLIKAEQDDKVLRKKEALKRITGFLEAAKNTDIDRLREERILDK